MGLNWPFMATAADDDGSRTSGSVVNKAAFQGLVDEIDANLFHDDYPTVTPATTTKRVSDSAGSFTDLPTRLDSIADPDTGVPNPDTFSGYVDVTSAADSLMELNLVPNDDLQLWSAGAAAAPDFTTLYNATIARAGLSEADTTRHIGRFSAKVTYTANPAGIYWTVLTAGAMTLVNQIRGQWKLGFGIWLATTVANTVRGFVTDGVQTVYTNYVAADGNFHFMPLLLGNHTINAAANHLYVGAEMYSAGSFYAFGPTAFFSSVAPARWHPCPTETIVLLDHYISGAVTTGNDKKIINPLWPCLIQDTQLAIGTAPTGQALIVDLDSIGAGGARTAVYATRPQIAAAGFAGNAVPDPAAWSTRCMRGVHGSSYPTLAGTLAFNVDQVGSSAAGSDLSARVTALRYRRPSLLDRFGVPAAGY